jgi:ribosomal-protein-alanine N-acetyltransferase
MQFSVLPESSHELVIVRPIAATDIAAWYADLSLPVVFEHTSWNLQSPDGLIPYVWGAEPTTGSSRLRLAVADRVTDHLVGTVGFHTVSPENRSAEVTYDLAPAVWGKGIASYVCGLLTDWAHRHVGLVRVQATVLQSNERSVRVLQRCRFREEGIMRSYRMVRGTPGDFFMYSHIVGAPNGT